MSIFKKVSTLMIFALVFQTTSVYCQSEPYGIFHGHTDIGPVLNPGNVQYHPETQTYTIAGAGTNMWFDQDEFHFVWQQMTGDFILRAQAHFVGAGVHPHRKLGWIIRSGLEANARHVNAVVHGDGLTALQFRKTSGGPTEEIRSAVLGADVIQLERKGQTYIMSVARFGAPFSSVEISEIELGAQVYAGLFVCSHDPEVVEQAVFRNVRIVIPARDNFVPYRDYIGSNLEILDLETGDCKVIYRSSESLQAPNWTPDGTALIYNSNGHLYRFDLKTRIPERIETEFAIYNNNDHVLSFDGKMLGLSHHSAEDGGKSIVYTVPVSGGKPRRITALGPSYLHGWSPDGQFLVYTGERNGEFDIYKIPATGGPEIRLTRADGLDDGSEFTPDGRYIYFNSSRSGTMQIWRMRPDGSQQEQITADAFNNWFPHISPDGRWIVFLSYAPEVAPTDHPFYRQVYLRKLPVAGGDAKVIAYVYGGQGTINVPSWAPDSKKLAFISNTDMRHHQ